MAHPLSPVVRVYQDLEPLAAALGEEILRLSQTSIADRGLFAMVLAGGNTPRALYRALAEEYRERIPWPQVHVFWGDELSYQRKIPTATPSRRNNLMEVSYPFG